MSSLFIGAAKGGKHSQQIPLSRVNRHGIIAGATGTGKTVTLQMMAESLSRSGVPVFAVDVKGDLSGMAELPEAEQAESFAKRAESLGMANYVPQAAPCRLWDVYGEAGDRLATTIESMGPLLLARALRLNDTQTNVLRMGLAFASDLGIAVNTCEDLLAVFRHMADNSENIVRDYGGFTPTSIAAMQRQLFAFKTQGASEFLGDIAFDIHRLFQKKKEKGVVNILNAVKLVRYPAIYSSFLVWLLQEMLEKLPETGDLDKPKFVLFFDEAHLIFDGASSHLMQTTEHAVRLIRSKGVGIYFITQNPTDIPDTVAGQLGNRIQHALRAFTPKDARALRIAASTLRPNPRIKTQEAISDLRIGEALVSLMQPDGSPAMVERVLIAPPMSRVGAPLEEYIPRYQPEKQSNGPIPARDYFAKASNDRGIEQAEADWQERQESVQAERQAIVSANLATGGKILLGFIAFIVKIWFAALLVLVSIMLVPILGPLALLMVGGAMKVLSGKKRHQQRQGILPKENHKETERNRNGYLYNFDTMGSGKAS